MPAYPRWTPARRPHRACRAAAQCKALQQKASPRQATPLPSRPRPHAMAVSTGRARQKQQGRHPHAPCPWPCPFFSSRCRLGIAAAACCRRESAATGGPRWHWRCRFDHPPQRGPEQPFERPAQFPSPAHQHASEPHACRYRRCFFPPAAFKGETLPAQGRAGHGLGRSCLTMSFFPDAHAQGLVREPPPRWWPAIVRLEVSMRL